ncbi:restriction endonuclease subunit S [Undibacterium sp. Ji42W]|uniref:restriction endonuclease subunit S n=1 Tax=Undibacterium sp. Ji42W TaxID=3413039 RepID=UPI003BEF8BB1
MSRYKAYPDYKDAESKWLDILPKDWKRAPLKYLVAIRITDGPHETPEFVDEGVPFLSAEAVKNNKLDFTKKRGCITRALHEVYSKKCLPQLDDVFMIKSGNTTGNIAIVETNEEFNIWSPLALIRSDKCKVLPRFVFYSMCADYFKTSVELSWSQGTQPNIGMGVIENLHIPVGSIEEQQTIANFLDHETAKIDTLIAKQQELIKLLTEKRQAVISHAVTKGLNPNAPMRDSGVEWLGEVPLHWKVASLKYLVSAPIIDGPHLTPTRKEEGIPFISAEAVSQGYINFEKKWGYISEEDHQLFSKRYCPQRGDILVVKLGATTGTVAIVETDEAFNVWVPLATIRTKNDVPSKFVFYLLQSVHVRDAFQVSWTFGTQQTLGLGTLANLSFPIPVKDEALKIVEFIESKIPTFDRLINECEVSYMLLQERRTALISAAVTGKIDVRDWQAISDTALAA